jgi:triphosphoribosyl-dephospho-CoA synthetase
MIRNTFLLEKRRYMTDIPPSFYICGDAALREPAKFGLAESLGAIAAIASFEETFLSPKPGLVDPCDNGSHDDMTWVTLASSACALAPFWRDQAMDGLICGNHYKPSCELLAKLSARGVEMERAMFAATGGVNSHKGLIFALSLLLGATGACASNRDLSPRSVCTRAAAIISPRVEMDFRDIRSRDADGAPLTHGERIFAEHGVRGIRGEAADGFPAVLSALEDLERAMSRGASYRDASLLALLSLMLLVEDTNVIHRSGIGFWRGEYARMTLAAKEDFDPLNPSYAPLLELNEFLTAHRASPGGAADLLTCTLFLYRSKMFDNIF